MKYGYARVSTDGRGRGGEGSIGRRPAGRGRSEDENDGPIQMDYSFSKKYHAMMRAYAKLQIISTDNGPNIVNTDAADLAEAFFNQCYHLKDWIKKDPVIGSKVDVEAYINKVGALRIVADYCNSLKHAGLDRKSRSGGQVEEVRTHMKIDMTTKGFVTSAQLEIILGRKRYNAYKLATDCVAAWKTFFARNSIIIDPP
jgi:hypothetical protein